MKITTPQERRLLRRAVRLWGIQTDYIDAFKQPSKTEVEVLVKILADVTGTEVRSTNDLEKLIARASSEKKARKLEPAYALREGQRQFVRFYCEGLDTKKLSWKITLEDGKTQTEPVHARPIRDGYFEAEIKTVLPVGYHELELCADKTIARSTLLCAPELEIRKEAPEKTWGVFAPIYGLRSERDWGMGDLQEMEVFQQAIHKFGASYLGTLPILPAINEGPNADPSPYSPVSRLFWNEIYLNVEDLARESKAAQEMMAATAFKKLKEQVRQSVFVDYQGVMALKKPILVLLANEFFQAKKDQTSDYQSFLKRSPNVEKYARFRAGQDEAEYRYHLYCQFQMDKGLECLSSRAQEGKAAGLYLDFPVGVSRGGFDATEFASSFLNGVSAGAPPDTVFIGGQNWGFAPFHPRNIREEGYRYFAKCMRHHMRHAKIVRLDHVMAFHRIYCVPNGMGAKSGGYIRYHAEEFFAVLAIEASRTEVEVIGEDLGTVPETMKSLLSENNCLGMWVLPFEGGTSPRKAIENARVKALACLNTHDMVPWEGYIHGHDIDVLQELKIINSEFAATARKERQTMLAAWTKDVGVKSKEDLFPKLTQLMAEGPSQVMLITMEDMWRETEPQNIPGTWREHPNWQRKLKKTTAEWMRDKNVTELFGKMQGWRK